MNLMEAESMAQLPRGAQWQYEPKWDGFRCLLIRDGSRISMQSKSGRDLVRYFAEVASAAAALSSKELILDGELLIQLNGEYSFHVLLQRIHPAASRVKHLVEETISSCMLICRHHRTKARNARFGRMDPAALQQHLNKAERHAAEGRQLVARQATAIADPNKHGHDTTDARKVLNTLTDTQAIHEKDVRRLRDELKAASQPLA